MASPRPAQAPKLQLTLIFRVSRSDGAPYSNLPDVVENMSLDRVNAAILHLQVERAIADAMMAQEIDDQRSKSRYKGRSGSRR